MSFIDRTGWRRVLRLLPWRRATHDEYLHYLLNRAGMPYSRQPSSGTSRGKSRSGRSTGPVVVTGSIGVLGVGGVTASALKDQLLLAVVFIAIIAICVASLISGINVSRPGNRTDHHADAPHSSALAEHTRR
ncbi:hypothetical protein [Streptomyces sp. NPDC005407]|uniref:hypothetical protein n=1 Tax=Streptomyces sp. NPDC005407 TaxID=3155340 RepID=UPI0033AE628C